jgi:molybdate transport system substrate-binding protein
MKSLQSAALIAAALAALPGAGREAAAENIQLLSAAALQSVFKEIAGDFERASGHTLTISYATMGAITRRIQGGETADVVIGSTPSIATLAKDGRIEPASQTTIGQVGVGVVVPAGAAVPRIDSIEDLELALLAAKVVVYADPAGGGAAGVHVARVLEKLGIAEQVKGKTTFGAGGDVTEVTLAQGQGALGLTQISEIVGKPGAELVGPLPREVQKYTGVTVGIPFGSRSPDGVNALIDFLHSPRATAVLKAKGM